MDEIRIGYFLEDIGHQRFLEAIVLRIVQEFGSVVGLAQPEVLNATGGRGKVFTELQDFLRDVSRQRERPFDLLIVAIDGNCRGYVPIRDEVLAKVSQTGYAGFVACAVPNPHIERWYIADPSALQQVLGVAPNAPRCKCERALYKNALRDAIRQAGIVAPLGGIEYGADIAAVLNLYAVGRSDAGFKHFLDTLREGLAGFTRSR